MRSCDRSSDSKNSGPIVHVLNGFYPEADVGRMNINGLERLVAALVKCTTEAADKPQWWPTTIAYDPKINLGLEDERESKLALKQLIVNCSQFFNKEQDDTNKWSVGWNADQPRKKRPRRRPPLVPLVPFVRLERPSFDSGKHQFLHYFRLNPKRCKPIEPETPPPPPPGNTLKFTNCTHIPFSSDVGQLMAAREQHRMPEDLKLKRLERSEWYTNTKETASKMEFEVAPSTKEVHHYHRYKMPKRQCGQRRPTFHDPEFLGRFCTPVYVVLERLDLEKVGAREGKQLVVMIDKSEKMCCDAKTKIVRTSPRLRNVRINNEERRMKKRRKLHISAELIVTMAWQGFK